MKRIIILLCCVCFLMSCASTKNYNYKMPPGKTDDDWGKDEQYCLDKAGKITGFFAHTIFGLKNINTEKKYEECLRELGWID